LVEPLKPAFALQIFQVATDRVFAPEFLQLLVPPRFRSESVQHLCEPRIAADGVPCGIKLQLAVVWAAGRFGKKHQPFHCRINIAYPRVNHRQISDDSGAIHRVVADRPQLDSTAPFGQCLFLARKSGIDESKRGE
jgi:hypothetical protein